MTKQETIFKAIEAQHIYCNVNKLPEFAPPSGRCWACGKNIYDPELDGHLDLNFVMTHLVTGCPYSDCHSTYCD